VFKGGFAIAICGLGGRRGADAAARRQRARGRTRASAVFNARVTAVALRK